MMRTTYDRSLRAAGHDAITIEIEPVGAFYYGPDSDQNNPGWILVVRMLDGAGLGVSVLASGHATTCRCR